MIFADSCSVLVSMFWDWTKLAAPKQEAVKFNKALFDNYGATEGNYPRDVLSSRLRFRGAGRSLLVRFESSEDKDFVLLGYTIDGNVSSEHTGAR